MSKIKKRLLSCVMFGIILALNCMPAFAYGYDFAFTFQYVGEKRATAGRTKSYDGDRYAYVTTKRSNSIGNSTIFNTSGQTVYFRVGTTTNIIPNSTRFTGLATTTGYVTSLPMGYYSGYGTGGASYMLISEADGNLYGQSIVGTWCS